MKKLIAILVALLATATQAQTSLQIQTGSSAPATSTTGDQFYDTSTTPVPTLLVAPAANQWVPSWQAAFMNGTPFQCRWVAGGVSFFGGSSASITTSGGAAASDGADISALKLTSAASTNAKASAVSALSFIYAAWNPDITLVAATDASSVAASRYWFAMGPTPATILASATPSNALVGFRYDTVADGTAFWRFCSNDGGDGTLNCLTSTVAVTANTVYNGRIKVISTTSADGWMNGVYIGRLSSDLPPATTSLFVTLGVTTLENVAKAVRCHKFSGYMSP